MTATSLSASILAVVFCASIALAQPASAPSSAPADPGAIQVTITGVQGMVQVRESEDKPWAKAQVDMVVGAGAEFRTGPRSAVRCFIPPDQTVTLDRLGVVKLLQVLRDGKTVKTRVGMQYGRTRYDIEEAGIEHRSELVTPSSTLAIRGTSVSVFDQPPFAPSAVSLTGRAVYSTARRQVAFGGKGQGKTKVDSDSDSAAQLGLMQTYIDPISPYGRPPQDQKLINQLQAKGDVVVRNGELALAFGGPVTDTQLMNLLNGQGRFNIALRWTGPGDFDLFVLGASPPITGAPYTLGNPSYKGSVFKDIGLLAEVAPITAARSPDGGQIKFDQIAFGGGGLEFASWGAGKNGYVPQQGYTVAVVYYDQRGRLANYPLRSSFKVDAFVDGKRLPVLTNFDELVLGTATELKFGPTYTGTASLIDSEKILVVDPPDKLKGDIRLTAVDITPEALGLDGKPIGNLNPGKRTRQQAAPAAAPAVRSGAATPAARPSARPAAAPVARPAAGRPGAGK